MHGSNIYLHALCLCRSSVTVVIGGTIYNVYINKKTIENYSMEDVERLEFKGPCCSANGQFNFTEQFNLV